MGVPQSILTSSLVDARPSLDAARPADGNEMVARLRRLWLEGDHDTAVRAIQMHKGPGYPLPSPIRSLLEEHFGCNLAAIRIHTDAFAERAAVSFDANAFTVQNDIFFGRGMYAPQDLDGGRRLVHELTHALQQRGQRRARSPELVATLENEAERAAAQSRTSLAELTPVAPLILREPTYPRRCTGAAMLREVERILSLSRDPDAGDETVRQWSRVSANFVTPPTAGTIARRVWTFLFLRHFMEPDARPGIESIHPRYFYSGIYSWIDGQHFFGFIDFGELQYTQSGGDSDAAFTAATAQGLKIETDQQRVRDYVVLKRPPATDVTRLMEVQPPNTFLFRGPQALAANLAQGAAEAFAALSLGDSTQGQVYSLLNNSQRQKFFVDSAKSAFTYEDFRSNQLGVRFFYQHGLAINALPGYARENAFRNALATFFTNIAVEDNQAVVDRLASGLPTQEQFSAGKTTEDTERRLHPELFRLPTP